MVVVVGSVGGTDALLDTLPRVCGAASLASNVIVRGTQSVSPG